MKRIRKESGERRTFDTVQRRIVVSTDSSTSLKVIRRKLPIIRTLSQNPKWRFAGIYADEGLSGTVGQKDDFLRMIKDCGKSTIS
ncbi:MAG: hypothetical protein ACLU3R_06425 [Acutalibacteraceae bacterium]